MYNNNDNIVQAIELLLINNNVSYNFKIKYIKKFLSLLD